MEVLTVHHNVFSMEDGERGETSLVKLIITTQETHPKRGKQHKDTP